MTGIYKIVNTINGDFYIGRSVNIKRRFMEHKVPGRRSRSCRLLYEAMDEYGDDNFALEIVELCDDTDDLAKKEEMYIRKLKPKYNISNGPGCSGIKHSEKTRKVLSKKARLQWERMSESEKRNIIQNNLKGPGKGHPVSEATRQKLREYSLGRKQSQETVDKRRQTMKRKKETGWVKDGSSCWKPVVCLETGEVFPSVKSAAAKIGAKPSSVSAVLKGRQKICCGYHFEYAKV